MATLKIENVNKTQETPIIINNELNINQNANNESKNNYQIVRYLSLYTLLQVIGLLILLSMWYWLQIYRNGFGFFEIVKICNWHPMLMTISFVYLLSNSILHFRIFRNGKKQVLKIQHTIIHTSIIIIGVFGIWTGLNSNLIANPTISRFYSFHSWLGIMTIIMFLFQFAISFFSFLYPGISIRYKEAVLPYHLFFGLLIFILAIVTTILGLNEKIIFAMNQQQSTYWLKEQFILNFIGITVILYSILVVIILIKPECKGSSKIEYNTARDRF